MCQYYRDAGHYEPYGRSGTGPDPVIRVHGWGQFGARLSHKLNADYLKLVLASVVLLVMVKILVELTFSPDLMLGIRGGR